MTEMIPLAGQNFRLMRSAGGAPETWTFVCLSANLELDIANEVESYTSYDCDDPTKIASRKAVTKQQTWGGSFSGKVDALKFATIRTDVTAGLPVRYQFLFALTGALGGGSYSGELILNSLKITKTENGIVSFSVAFQGNGAIPAWVAAT